LHDWFAMKLRAQIPQTRTRRLRAVVAAAALLAGGTEVAIAGPAHAVGFPHVVVAAAPTSDGGGYWDLWADGSVTTSGTAVSYGDMAPRPLRAPMVSIAPTPSGHGYWLLGADGGVFSFGDAGFYGSTGGMRLNRPAVQMVSTVDGRGYWFVASDGGIFAFGDAPFYGSAGSLRPGAPIVGMAATPSGHGYWLVAADGGVFSFGDALFHGSMGGQHLNRPVVGMAATATGNGHWLLAADGGVFGFGDAKFYGSAAAEPGSAFSLPSAVGLVATRTGYGYWIVAVDGTVSSYGDAMLPNYPTGFNLAPGGPSRVLLYGDSLSYESRNAFTALLADAGVSVMTRTFGGTAICDWIPQMETDVQQFNPVVTVVQFSGNDLTPCMTARVPFGSPISSIAAAYQADAAEAASILTLRGGRVIFAASPITLTSSDRTMQNMYAALAGVTPGTSFVDAGQAVTPGGAFTWTMPCLSGEAGCSNGAVVVRSPDGTHFCPGAPPAYRGIVFVCPVWNGGGFRFGAAMAAAARQA
jgi:hypothetical protein